MIEGLPRPFPPVSTRDPEDHNPAIRLFGRRFFTDQGALELLAEFMAVALCEKRIQGIGRIDTALPQHAQLSSWPAGAALEYRPPVKLNLKLFAFLAASRIDTRHRVHEKHYAWLSRELEERITFREGRASEAVEWLEELLRGFEGAGLNRAWCAQTFFPMTAALLTRETIWNASVAKRSAVSDWRTVTDNLSKYFSMSRRDLLARGGELLYLQVCNALATDPSSIGHLVRSLREAEPSCILGSEADPRELHMALQQDLAVLRAGCTAPLDRLIDVVEGLDPETVRAESWDQSDGGGWLSCAWCPRDSWQEGYLFTVELSRVLRATLDPVERLEMLTVGCSLQVLRSLCAQSARYAAVERAPAPLGYAWLIAPPQGADRALRLASHRNLQVVQSLIHQALRIEALSQNAQGSRVPIERLYREADSKYGHKLFLSLGKKLGFIVPRRGPGARFTMTDDILRYLVLALLRPGERCTYDSFLKRLRLHYGIATEGDFLSEAAAWSALPQTTAIQPANGGWLAASLRAGGFLTELSDACSIVRNTYTMNDELSAGGAA